MRLAIEVFIARPYSDQARMNVHSCSLREVISSRPRLFRVKKPDRIQLARQIIERVKKEMQEPRLTESVRNSMRGKIGPYSSEPAIKLEKV